MRSRYYNPADSQERENLQAAIDLGHTIVCTSRPLPGETAWVGEWCGGIHWATGVRSQIRCRNLHSLFARQNSLK
jgi:hypothetical protein